MTEKPKRKNDEPIPRRYWWIFGTLAILLLIPWRTPEGLDFTFWGYVCVWLLVGMIAATYAASHGIRHFVSLVMLACLILPLAQSLFILLHEPAFNSVRSDDNCEREQHGLLQIKTCAYGHCIVRGLNGVFVPQQGEPVTYPARYVTLMDLPIYILIEPIWDDNFHYNCYGG